MPTTSLASSKAVVRDLEEYATHMAAMLMASRFSIEEKNALAALVPFMTEAQLVTFDNLLRTDIEAQNKRDLQGLLVAAQAAQHKRDLALAALDQKVSRQVDALIADEQSAA